MKYKLRCTCILFITTICSVVVPHVIERRLFQSNNENIISVSNANELKESLENLKNIIISKNSIIELIEKITILTNDTIITGELNNENEKPIITCKNNNGNILILGNNITISNLEIKDCNDGPVIQIESNYNNNVAYNYNKIELSNLDFNSNIENEKNNDYKGGALYIGEGNSVNVINSNFRNNLAEQGAGIYLKLPSELRIENSVFENNVAEIAGAALYTQHSSFKLESSYLEIRNCNFKNNGYTTVNEQKCNATSSLSIESPEIYNFTNLCLTEGGGGGGGGALFLQNINELSIKESNFEYNYGTVVAGAIFLNEIFSTNISSCNFTSNLLKSSENGGISYGGAIYVLNSDSSSLFNLWHSSFINNTAVHGGAIHFLATKGNYYYIENTDFSKNDAQESGGAIVVRNKNMDITGNRFNRNKAYIGGAIILANGALTRFHTGMMTGELRPLYNNFSENSAADGGAIAAVGSGNIEIIEAVMERNAAGRTGGAIYILEHSTRSLIELKNVTFNDNIAVKGGAIYGQSVKNLEIKEDCKFMDNKAVSGGAIYFLVIDTYKDIIKLNDTSFENNLVRTSYEDLIFPDIVQNYLNLNILTPNAIEFEKSPILLSQNSDDPCYPGGGGAFCLYIIDTPDARKLHIELSNLIFKNNYGYVGGAIMIIINHENLNNCENDECHVVNVLNCEFYGNVASGAGGAIFAFYPERIKDNSTGYSLFVEDESSLKFENNSVIEGGYGKDVAASAFKLEPIDLNPELLNNINSNEDEIEIKIGIYDCFDQHIISGVESSEIVINARSDGNNGLFGTTHVKAIGGISNFRLKYNGRPDVYPLEFHIENYDAIYKVNITIRDCYIGESRVKEFECLVCENGFYGFDPYSSCYACPENAICEGSHHLFPIETYWHSSPFSPLMHRCLYKQACQLENRMSQLRTIKNLIVNGASINISRFPEYIDAQCTEGYTGILCASCDKGYAHKTNGKCIKCEKTVYSGFMVGLYFLWTFVLLSITVRSALTTVRDIHVLENLSEEKQLRKIKTSVLDKINTVSTFKSQPSIGTSSSLEMQRESSDLTLLIDCNKKDETKLCEIIQENEDEITICQDIANDGSQTIDAFSDNPSRILKKKINDATLDKIISAEKLSEMIKIFINFLKVNSVAIFVNIKWTETIRRILYFSEIASGFSGSSTLSPIECYLSEDPHDRAFYGLIFRIFYILIISAFLLSIFYIYWLYLRFKHKTPLSHFTTRSIIVTVVTLFFGYDSITSHLMRIINCIELDIEQKFNIHDSMGIEYFEKYSNATESYWVEDPHFICYEDKHAILVFSLAILGLLLFSIGVPVALTISLLYLRHTKVCHDEETINKIGFVYRGYVEQFIFWEVIIILRKALVQVVVVYAYPLRENLQCVILLGIMIIALFIQIIAWPFEYAILNYLETASLVVSFLTFYFGLIFNDDRTSDTISVTLSVLLLLATIFLYITFIVCIICFLNNLITASIRMTNKDVPDNYFRKVALFVNINLSSTIEKAKTARYNTKNSNDNDDVAI